MTTNFDISSTSSFCSITRTSGAPGFYETTCLDPISLPFDSAVDIATNQWKYPLPNWQQVMFPRFLSKLYFLLIQMKKETWAKFKEIGIFLAFGDFTNAAFDKFIKPCFSRRITNANNLYSFPWCWIQRVSIERNSNNKFTYYS